MPDGAREPEAPPRRERDALAALGIARRAGAAAVGTRAVREAARAGRLRAIVLARDAAPNARSRLSSILADGGLHVLECGSRQSLGAAVGKGPTVVVGVTDRGLADRVMASLARGPK